MGGNPPDGEVTENGLSTPLDFSTTSSSSSEDQQPVNLSERLLPVGNSPPNPYASDANRKFPIKAEFANKVSQRLGVLLTHPLVALRVTLTSVVSPVPSLQLRELRLCENRTEHERRGLDLRSGADY